MILFAQFFNTTNYDNLKLDLPNELDEPANVLVFISISC